MGRYLMLFTAVVLMSGSVVAAEPEPGRVAGALDSDAIVIVAPPSAPVSIASFDGSITENLLTVQVAINNESAEDVHRAGVSLITFDRDRKMVGALTYRSGAGISAGKSHLLEFTVPLAGSFDSGSKLVVIPTAASGSSGTTWRVPGAQLQLLVNRLSSANWSNATQALAVGRDVLPRGERVQTNPPNCTFGQCAQNADDCNDGCFAGGYFDTCAYCDRRRTGEGCSTVCYCLGITQGPCPPPPDGWM